MAGLALVVLSFAAYGLSFGPLPWLKELLPLVGPVLAPIFLYLGVTSPKMVFGRSSERGVTTPGALIVVINVIALGAVVSALSRCTPAQSAAWGKVEPTVLADIEAGDSLPQIETDVEALFPASPAQAFVDELVNTTIAFLLQVGKISVGKVPHAQALRSELAVKLAAPQSFRMAANPARNAPSRQWH